MKQVLTFENWMSLLWKSRGLCYYCRHRLRDSDSVVMEHVYPLLKGGAHSKRNVVPACQQCNTVKADLTPERWLAATVRTTWQIRHKLIPRIRSIVQHRRYELDAEVSASFGSDDEIKPRGAISFEVWNKTERLYSRLTLYQAVTQFLWIAAYEAEWQTPIYVKDRHGNIAKSLIPRRPRRPRDDEAV